MMSEKTVNDKTLKEIISESAEKQRSIGKQLLVQEPTVDFTNIDFLQTSLDDYKEFEERSEKKGEGYLSKRFPILTEKLEGIDEGLYLICAESNTGKSAVLIELLRDLATNRENKLYGLYYSLDDTKFDIIPRVIAADQLIPIGLCTKPNRYRKMIENGEQHSSLYEMQLEKREAGLQKLKEQVDCFKIEDGNTIKNATDLFNHMKAVQRYVKALDPDANIVVGIDAVDDIRFERSNMTTTERHALTAKTIKDWSTELHIPIFGTRHLKKLGANRRPTIDDLKDSNEYVYEASVVWLLHCDVSKNKQAATIFYQQGTDPTRLPVIEIDWAKNKKSSFKGNTYCYFRPEFSQVLECNKEDNGRFDTILFSTI